MIRWKASRWVGVAAMSYAGNVVGIVVAAVVSSRVSVTVGGVAAAAAVLTASGLLAVLLVHVASGQPEKLWPLPTALFLVAPVLLVSGLLVSAQVVPGFDVHGFWGYVILLVATFGVDEGLSWLGSRVDRSRLASWHRARAFDRQELRDALDPAYEADRACVSALDGGASIRAYPTTASRDTLRTMYKREMEHLEQLGARTVGSNDLIERLAAGREHLNLVSVDDEEWHFVVFLSSECRVVSSWGVDAGHWRLDG